MSNLKRNTLAAIAVLAVALAIALKPAAPAVANPNDNGVVTVKSAHGFNDTVAKLKEDISKKGIKFFLAVDQSALGADAGLKLYPSTLLIFGNPPLGIQFLTSHPNAGLDWPVRLLVRQDANGQVWAVYTDFAWIAERHGITDREAQFKMASDVIASITASVGSK